VTEIDKLMQFSGGKAIYRGNAIQRGFLDIPCARAMSRTIRFPISGTSGRSILALRTSTWTS